MKRAKRRNLKVLVIDVGGSGSHVQFVATHHRTPMKFKSGVRLAPGETGGARRLPGASDQTLSEWTRS